MGGGSAPTAQTGSSTGGDISLNPNYASQYNPMSGLEPLAMLQQYRSGVSQGISPGSMMQQYQQSRSMPAQFTAPLSVTQNAYAPYVPPPPKPPAFPIYTVPTYTKPDPPDENGYTTDRFGKPIYNPYG